MTAEQKAESGGEKQRLSFRDLSLQSRLIIAFLAVAVIASGAACFGLYSLDMISRQLKNVVERDVPLLDNVQKLEASLQQGHLLSLNITDLEDPAKINQLVRDMEVQEEVFVESFMNLEKLVRDKGLDLAQQQGARVETEKREQTASSSTLLQSSLELAGEKQKEFRARAGEMTATHGLRLKLNLQTQAKLDELRTMTKALGQLMEGVIQVSETSFAANEEAAKTSVQMGKASVEKLNDIIRQFYDVDYPLISGLQKLKGYMDEANEIAVRYVAARNAKRLPEIQQDFEAKLKASSSLIERLQQRKASTEIEEGLTQVGKVLDGMKDAVLGDAGVFALHTEAQKAAQAAANSRSTMIEAAKACEAAIGEVHKKLSQAVETAKTNSIQVAATARRWELFILGMGFLASIVLALLLAKSMSSPIKVLARQIARISQGDPTAEVSDLKRRDELGTLAKGFRALLETLRGDQTRRLLDTVNIVSRSAAEISATVAQLTANTSRVSAAVAETSATVEEVKQAAQLASEKAKKVAESAQQAVQTSESGKKASEETIARINLIKEQMQSIGETVVRLSDHSQTVAEIMDVVQDIAEQSNLLAVNASIEAARAGDYGKGFGVVAQEIKSLADQSRNATLQVRSILGDTQKWISAVVMATEQGGKAVDAGVAQSVVSAESLLALAQSLVGSDQAAQIIYGSAQQQFAGVKQISTAMESISEAMKQDVAGVEQLQSAVHRLQDLGEELNRLAERLRV